MNRTPTSGGVHGGVAALAGLLLALLAAACGESPAAPEDAPGAVPASGEAQVATPLEQDTPRKPGIPETLSDPFVAELVGHLEDRALAARLDSGIRAARTAAREGRDDDVRRAVDELLPSAEPDAAVSGRPDDAVILAVLALILPEADGADPTTEGALR